MLMNMVLFITINGFDALCDFVFLYSSMRSCGFKGTKIS